nr:MBL fold metallo-hydrolase [Bacteroidota bacterium]
IGCGDAFASGGRFNTCFYLHNQQHHVLIDCGASSLVNMKKLKMPVSEIEFIIISHLHGDHFGGIPFFLLDAQYNQKRNIPVTIVGPEGTALKVKKLMEILYPGIDLDTFSFNLNFIEYESNKLSKVGPLSIVPYPVLHSKGSQPHGLRINFSDKIFAFSGDTEWTDALPELSKDADLFICESNYYDNKAPNHLDYKTILKQKDKFSCKKLMLNHLGEEMISKIDVLEIDCVEDGQVIEL